MSNSENAHISEVLYNLLSVIIIGGTMSKTDSRMPEGMGWRVSVSIITFFGAVIAAILWLFFYAGGFNIYQNIAVVVVIFLVFIAIMGTTWASWGMKNRALRRKRGW